MFFGTLYLTVLRSTLPRKFLTCKFTTHRLVGSQLTVCNSLVCNVKDLKFVGSQLAVLWFTICNSLARTLVMLAIMSRLTLRNQLLKTKECRIR